MENTSLQKLLFYSREATIEIQKAKIWISALRCQTLRSKWPPVAELSKAHLRYPGNGKRCWFLIPKPDAVEEFQLALLSQH